MYWFNVVVVAVSATVTMITMLNSKSNSILGLMTKIKLIQSQSQVHNHSMPMSYCNVTATFYTQISETTVCEAYRPSIKRHLRAVRICAAALNSRLTAAELGRVALLFRKKTKILGRQAINK